MDNPTRYMGDPDDARVLADSTGLRVMQIEKRAFAMKAVEVSEKLDRPQIVNEGDTRQDVRYVAGFLAGLRWREELLDASRKIVHASASKEMPE